MLSEGFVASIGIPERETGQKALQDAGILTYDLRPTLAQQAVYKKSAAPPCCVAVSQRHVFAAQAGKAVVYVYSRSKANQEAIVPFPETITCIALACHGRVLILGTAAGKLFLWETGTGRQITTPASHIQEVTALAVDPESNFVLSASKDSTVHIWSIPALLSFSSVDAQSLSPSRTFSVHRTEIAALAIGHSSSFSNFAVSASTDCTCLIWNYHTNTVLRTYLLYSAPLCLSLDPADRSVYVGCEDGTIQPLHLHESLSNDFYSPALNAANGLTAIQPSRDSIWRALDTSHGPVLCLDVSFDSCTVLTGHKSGAVLSWDAGRARFSSNVIPVPLAGPVTNLEFLSPVEYVSIGPNDAEIAVDSVIKPKFAAFDDPYGAVAVDYVLHAELCSSMRAQRHSVFQQALCAANIPSVLIEEGLDELSVWHKDRYKQQLNGDHVKENEDFVALEEAAEQKQQYFDSDSRITELQAELEALRRVQTVSFQQMNRMRSEQRALLHRQQKRQGTQATNGGSNNSLTISDTDDED